MPTKRRLPQWAVAIALAVAPTVYSFADEAQQSANAPAAEQPLPGEKPAPIEKPVKAPEKSDKPMPMPVEPPPPVERKLDKPKPAPDKPIVAPPTQDKPASDKPASAKADEPEFPTPAQLFERMKKLKAEKAALTKVAYFDMAAMPVLEGPLSFSLFADTTPFTLRAWVQRLHAARDDKDVRGILINLGSGASFNLAQAQELRDALVELRQAGKKTFVYADSFDTVGYTVASGATNVCLLEGGEIMIPGVGLEATFYKGIFDKVGVKADYVQIGEYKGADESYTRTEASPELRGEFNKLTDAMYEQLINDISHSRNVSRDSVKQLIDDTIVTAKDAKQRGFVDHLLNQDQLRKLMTDELGNQIDLIANYGHEPQGPAEAGTNPLSLLANLFAPRLGSATAEEAKPAKPQVALIYAEGVITDGGDDDSLFSESGVASDTMRKTLRQAARDENIKAIVIRIDSPGGSALASEVMWQAARAAAAKKPVIISVGSMAASGGYYLASAGDYIFSDPSGIVGSIGVVGGKFVYKDLFDKLGINTETFSRGRNAGLFSSNAPFDDRQRRMVTNWMKGTYDQFTERVMTTRKGKIKDIDQVARGRIFLAKQAKDLGMVDEIGGINTALAFAAKRGKLTGDSKSYDIKVLPQPKTLSDFLGGAFGGGGGGGNSDTATPFRPKIELSPDSILRTLDPATRQVMRQQLQMIDLLQKRPVVLLAPYVVTVK
jgi:protease-4